MVKNVNNFNLCSSKNKGNYSGDKNTELVWYFNGDQRSDNQPWWLSSLSHQQCPHQLMAKDPGLNPAQDYNIECSNELKNNLAATQIAGYRVAYGRLQYHNCSITDLSKTGFDPGPLEQPLCHATYFDCPVFGYPLCL